MLSLVQILFLSVVFVGVFAVAMLIMWQFSPRPVQQRLQLHTEQPAASENGKAWLARLVRLSTPLAKLSLPSEGWQTSGLRTRFLNAGFRGDSAPTLYFAMKTLLAVVFPLFAWLAFTAGDVKFTTNSLMSALLLISAIGYFLPNLILSRIIALRQREVFEHFPEMLDLLTICVEAGLAIDAAIGRIAQEIAMTSPVLSEELYLATLELRAGSSKDTALRNLAMRTGVEDVDALVSMLIQAERFGTSIAESLRVHADGLRTKRRQRAEEAAAKIALKLLFPLIFCFFPALMAVLMTPAILQIVRVLLPAIGAH